MIGHYVHHHGSGHLHRALTLAPHLPGPVTGLSSLPRPDGWDGPWVRLPRDDAAPSYADADPTAGGRLHWVPRGDRGLRDRMAVVSAWIREHEPIALVVDQSVEVCLLARLHGVPVVAFTAPGRRTDPPHVLGFGAADAVVGAWPDGLTPRLLPGDPVPTGRVHAVGAVSRLPVGHGTAPRPAPGRRRHAVLLAGTGGDGFTPASVAHARQQTPEWDWTVLSRTLGTWNPDPAAVIASADVVVLHPGQNALAEVAALRRPAVLVPAPRPFDEQHVTAAALSQGWPAIVADAVPDRGWADVLNEAAGLDGREWARWCDGGAPQRVAGVVAAVVGRDRAA